MVRKKCVEYESGQGDRNDEAVQRRSIGCMKQPHLFSAIAKDDQGKEREDCCQNMSIDCHERIYLRSGC